MALLHNWDRLTPEQRELAIIQGEGRANAKKGQAGKDTEDKTKDAIERVRQAVAWNSNNGVPLCDKVCCWKGRFILIECKECRTRELRFNRITKSEHLALQAIERPQFFGLGLVVVRYLSPCRPPQGFLCSYSVWLACAPKQRYKYFDLENPPAEFLPFSWAQIAFAYERGLKSEFELQVDRILADRPLPQLLKIIPCVRCGSTDVTAETEPCDGFFCRQCEVFFREPVDP